MEDQPVGCPIESEFQIKNIFSISQILHGIYTSKKKDLLFSEIFFNKTADTSFC